MMVGFVTWALALVLGYAYPAYECFKTVELNKPEIEQLRFWCQYWILVAALTVFERVGDTFVSWLPMYGEAKLAFFIYLWYPKTKGTTYVYETFFRPYVSKHETDIDRNLLELRTRAGDMLILYWQKAATYGQTRVFEILQYVAAQSQAQPSRPRPRQQQTSRQAHQTSATRRPVVSQQDPPPPAASPTKRSVTQELTKAEGGASSADLPSSSGASSETTIATAPSEPEAMQIELPNAAANNDVNLPPQVETPIEEAIRVTRGGLRKRAAISDPSTQ